MSKVVAKVVLVNAEGRILILRRSKTCNYAPGKVDFPGGGVEAGEDILAAAIRETQEEVGTALHIDSLTVAYASTSEPNVDGDIITRVLLTSRIDNLEIKLSYEHDAFWWHELSEPLTDFDHASWGNGLQFIIEHKLLEAQD